MFARRFATLALLAFTFGLVACDDDAGSGTGAGAEGDGASSRFFLGTGSDVDNTAAPRIEIDRDGGVHAVYPAYAGGRSYYAYCPRDCTPESLKVVRFETDGTVANAMLALDGAGRPHVLLSSFSKIYYASCTGDCTTKSGWRQTELLDHGNELEVSGEAFALDSSGRPRFLMHTYRAYLGIGQKPPKVWWAACDADCHDADAWTASQIAEQMWYGSTLRFGPDGRPRVATVAEIELEDGSKMDAAAYVECNGDCTKEASWTGVPLMQVYQSEYEAVALKPTLSMALTKSGAPRIVTIGKQDDRKAVTYYACDSDCVGEGWEGVILSDHADVGPGLDLALDANDRPRFVYTLDYDVFLARCDEARCETADAKWDLTKVEAGSDMPPDEIFLYENCHVGAWFLHSPSLALTADGKPRVGYQARDISGGWKNPDPTKPRCEAGTDMTWTRMAVMGSM